MQKTIQSTLVSITLLLGSSIWAQEFITVVSFGGSYAKACVEGYHKPFEEATGIEVRLEDYNGELSPLRAQVEAGAVSWDVIDLEGPQVTVACEEGLIIPLDDLDLPPGPNGEPAEEDFAPGTLYECGIGSVFYATVVAFNPDSFPGQKPSRLEHFFDLEKYPGRRAVHRSPQATLEMALMASGVAPEHIYATLESEEGLSRAFQQLEIIKDSIVWWEAGAQPPQMLADREVSMAIAWNGRIFNAQVIENQPIEIIWDGRIIDSGGMAIADGAPNLENARRFVEFAARVESEVGVASHIAYAPVRKSALALVGNHAITGTPMAPHLPINPDHEGRLLKVDIEFWLDRREELVERFQAWLSR